MIHKPKSRRAYIQSLPLMHQNHNTTSSKIHLNTEPSGKVVAGNVTSFVDSIPVTRQQDVLNSTLLAQLAANKKFDRERETEQWYSFYNETMSNVGWILGDYVFDRQQDAGTTIRLDTKSLQLVAKVASGNELNILSKSINGLKGQSKDGKAITLFDNNGSGGSGGNFQLGSASLDTSENINLVNGAFYFQADRQVRRFLFITWEQSSVNFYAGAQRMILNDSIYGTVRQAVIDKLGDLVQQYVANIDI